MFHDPALPTTGVGFAATNDFLATADLLLTVANLLLALHEFLDADVGLLPPAGGLGVGGLNLLEDLLVNLVNDGLHGSRSGNSNLLDHGGGRRHGRVVVDDLGGGGRAREGNATGGDGEELSLATGDLGFTVGNGLFASDELEGALGGEVAPEAGRGERVVGVLVGWGVLVEGFLGGESAVLRDVGRVVGSVGLGDGDEGGSLAGDGEHDGEACEDEGDDEEEGGGGDGAVVVMGG